jgi:peptidoglycan/xylan/chitin deacetylase (PgdA/CDA1 family)
MNRSSATRSRFGPTNWQSFLGDVSYAVAVERLGPWLTERVFWRLETDDKKVALTFDDGPNDRYTPALLDLLARHRVPATFFLVGSHLKEQPSVARDAVAAGHEIGNHTYSHPSLLFMASEKIVAEVSRTDQLIRDLLGVQARLMRPPMGLFTKRVVEVIEGIGYRTVVGDVYPRDPHEPGRQKIVARVLERVRPGSVIILHDGGNSANYDRSHTVQAVAEIVPALVDQGYEFVRVSDLLAEVENGRLDNQP